MVLGSCFSDLNFLQFWSPSLKYPTRIRLNVRFGVYFLWTLKGVTFFLGFSLAGREAFVFVRESCPLEEWGWELSRPRFALEVFTAGANDFFIFAFSRPSPVVGHVTHSSGELCVSLGMVSQLTPASIFG